MKPHICPIFSATFIRPNPWLFGMQLVLYPDSEHKNYQTDQTGISIVKINPKLMYETFKSVNTLLLLYPDHKENTFHGNASSLIIIPI